MKLLHFNLNCKIHKSFTHQNLILLAIYGMHHEIYMAI